MAPCPCGSGLRAASCCALPAMAPPPAEAVRHLLPLVERAARALDVGAADAAMRLCLDVLELAPCQVGALSVLYRIRARHGPAPAAEALIRRIAALDPNDGWALAEITRLLLAKGVPEEAEPHARNFIRIAPENPQAHNLMGMVMTEAHKPQVGEYHYRQVLILSGQRDPILLANLAWNLSLQGRMAESRALYRESVQAAPDVPQTLLGWARMEEADRKFEAAAEALARLERVAPEMPGGLLMRAVLLGRMRREDEALAVFDRIAARGGPDGGLDDGLDGGLGPTELLEKGRLLDRMGRYDDAWAAFALGKQRARALGGYAYMEAHAAQLAQRLKQFFIAGRLRILPRAGVREDVAQPLFIAGFPRSGTTLVEQSLSAHPRIAAGDELPLIGEITELLPRMFESPLGYPEALAELWMGDKREGLDNLRDYYLQKVRQMGILAPEARQADILPDAAWFTDKMPLNETHLGLIGLVFPASPVLHVLRHPLDIVLSVFSNHLTHGYHCAFALESVARHVALIHDLVAHYRQEMALRYMALRYEDIVADLEGSLRDALAFAGEDFDPRCLRFHENQRYARTASYAQVTEPLYASSRYRYRNYIRHLEPVLPILAPVIERLGYRVD